MCNKQLETGDRVMLSNTTKWDTDDNNNPLGVIGTVVDGDSDSGWVDVRWDNGKKNSYKGRDNDLVKLAKNRSSESLCNGDRVMMLATNGDGYPLGLVGTVADINIHYVLVHWDNYVESYHYYMNYTQLVVVDDE